MKFLLIFSTLLSIALQMDGQAPLQIDPSQYSDWEQDSLYNEAELRLNNVENPASIRLQFAEIGLNRALEEENYFESSAFASKSAVVYTELGMNQEALSFSLQALQYARKTPEKRDDIWSLYRLAEIHSILKNPDQALLETREALHLAIERDTLIEIGWAYNEFGEIYRRLNQLDSAAFYYRKALETFHKNDYKIGIQSSTLNLGLTYASGGQYDQALEEFDKSESIDAKSDVIFWLEYGEGMVEVVLNKYSVDSAIAISMEMVALAEEENFPRWEKKFKSRLADLHRQNGEWEKAWKYHREADSLEELQTGERIRLQTSVTDHQYRMQLLKAEHELTTQQNQNRILIWISILLVAGLLAAAVLLQITKNQRIRKINQQLSQQNDSLDELIGEKDIWINLMAHDLKAPLNAIEGLLEMLKVEDLPPEIREKALGNISKSVHKGSTLISQLLEISRLESSNVQTNIQDTNLNDLVVEVEKIFTATAEHKDIELHLSIPQDKIEVSTDPVHAQHILENFVSNALKFSPKGKKVQLVLEDRSNHIAVHVIDEGPGMSAVDQENLFLKFKRLSAQPTGGESSTGLGLSIVKQLADRIGAQIQVHSELGKGSSFILLLPKQHVV